MDLKRAFIGAIVPVAIFAVAFTYFTSTITNAILGQVDLASILASLPFAVSVNTVILAAVGLVAGIIGGFLSGKKGFAGALILTLIFSVGVVAGNLIYGAFSITSVQDVLSLDANLVLTYLQSNLLNSVEYFAGGIGGMVVGLLIGSRFTGRDED